MSLVGKIFVVVNAILSLVFVGITSTLYFHSTDWRLAFERFRVRHGQVVAQKDAEITSVKDSLKQADDRNKSLDGQLAVVKDQLKNTEGVVATKSEETNKARADFDELKAAHNLVAKGIEAKETQLADANKRIEQLNADLQKGLSEKETAEAQVARLIGQKAALEKDLAEVRKDYSDTKQRLLDMQLTMEELERQGIPVGTLVVNHKPIPPINGKVAGVKADTNPALVVLTVGKDDKVEKGFNFTVYRGAEFIGRVIVEKVTADTAGCRVLFTAPGKVIKAGDDVATRLD